MGEGHVNGRDQDSVFSSEMGSIEAGAVSLMGYEKQGFLEKDTNGWAAVEREREEMREMKLKLKQRNSPKSKTAIKDHRMQGTPRKKRPTPRKKRPLEQLAAVPGSESGETDDATEKLENKHDVVENASRCVESVSTKQRDVRRSERKIVKMLALSELKKKEENMYRRNKGLTDDEKGSTEKNGNEEACNDPEGNPTRGKKQKFILDKGNASDVGALLSKSMAEKGLPRKFCQLLPENDCIIVLQDEEGQVFETVYLARRTGLSGGWRGFSIAHQLVAGDALVFQLVEPTKLKVYIIQANSCGMSDGVPESQK